MSTPSPSPVRIHRIDSTHRDDYPLPHQYGDGDVIWHVPTGLVLIAVANPASPASPYVPVNLRAVSRATRLGAYRRAWVPAGASTAAWWRTAYGGRYAASYDQAETMLTRAEIDANDAGCTTLVAVSYQHSSNGLLVAYPGNDFDTLTVFNGDGCNEVTVTRTKTGMWRLLSSDYHCDAVPPSVWERRRYDNPGAAIAEVQTRTNRLYIEVADWVTELPAAA